ncbi:MAG: hypothetical protein P8O05_12455 [Flavobacteriales bacterium]|nr:hypothetical protein [Flavobacteriales bacterium]
MSTSSSENDHPSPDSSQQKVRKKVRVRKERNVLDDKVRKYRHQRESSAIKRQRIERIMYVMAGTLVLVFLLNIVLALFSTVELNWLTWIMVIMALIGLVIWAIQKAVEATAMKRYRFYRQQQRERDNDL